MNDVFYQPRSLRAITKAGFDYYAQAGGLLTWPLVLPIVEQLVGVLLWLGLSYGVVDWLLDTFPLMNPVVLWVCFLLANLPGMLLFIDGFWRYLLWVAGLNLVVRDLVNDQLDRTQWPYHLIRVKSRALDYSLLWLFLFGVMFIPLTLAMLVQLIPLSAEWRGLLLAGSVGVMLVGYGVVVLIWLLTSLSFQVFAFTPDSVGLVLLRSIDLVQQNRCKTLALVLLTLVLTQLLIPSFLVGLIKIVGGSSWLGSGVGQVILWVVSDSIGDLDNLRHYVPELAKLWDFLVLHFPWVSQVAVIGTGVVEMVVYSLISALLLPLSTIWFALLYADSKVKLESNVQ